MVSVVKPQRSEDRDVEYGAQVTSLYQSGGPPYNLLKLFYYPSYPC